MVRKIYRSMLLLFLIFLAGGYSLIAQQVWGWNLSNSLNDQEVGPCSFDIQKPSEVSILHKKDFGICAGAFVGKKYYCYTYKSTGTSSQPIAFGLYDFKTGVFTQIADYSQQTTLFYDMTYDYAHGKMYALGLNQATNTSTLLLINLTTGAIESEVNLPQRYYTLASNKGGVLYVIDEYGSLYTISTTGEASYIGDSDYFPDLITQSMSFDHNTETLYWVIPTNRSGTSLLKINTTKGWGDDEKSIPNDMQIVGFDFPFVQVDPKAPEKIGGTIEANPQGALSVHFSLICPSKNMDGEMLTTPLTVVVKRGDELILTKEGLSAGAKLNYTDQVSQSGLYSYSLIVRNAAGDGEERVEELFVGKDIPASVSNIILTKKSETDCVITWDAPTKGVNGGVIDSNIKYEILRLPDNKIISDVQGTSYEDKDVKNRANYSYKIIPITAEGRGSEASSSSIVLGGAYAVPYECAFTNEDMPLWQIFDRDKDGVQWRRMMTSEGVQCSMSAKESDDWIVSSPIHFESKVNYKLKFSSSVYNEDYADKLALYIGKGTTEEALKTFQLVKDFVITNEEGKRGEYICYFTLEKLNKEAGDYSIAFQKHSAPDLFNLELHKLKLTQAGEGTLQGKVMANGMPVSGAFVQVQGTNFSTQTKEDGSWIIEHIPEKEYTIEVRKDGYAIWRQKVQVELDNILNIDSSLELLKKVSLQGKVLFDTDKPLKDAFVSFSQEGMENPVIAYSKADGTYSFAELYEGVYKLTIKRAGLKTYQKELTISPNQKTIPTIVLEDEILAPRLLKVTESENQGRVELEWKAPIATEKVRYFSGDGVARLGVWKYTKRSIIGTIFRKDMALCKISWITDGERAKHRKVDIVIFALDEKGEPTRTILYEAKDVENRDNEWMSYELETPLKLKRGALVAFRYEGYLDLQADGGTNVGIPFKKHTYVLNKDYEKDDFEYLDQHSMEKNLLIEIEHATLMPNGEMEETLQRNTGYSVYRQKVDKHGVAVEAIQRIGTTNEKQYKDSKWGEQTMGYYRYSVRGLNTQGDESKQFASSEKVGKDLLTDIKFTIETAAYWDGDNKTPSIELFDEENTKRYIAKGKKHQWFIKDLPKGRYTLTAKLDGFETIHKENLLFDKENSYTYELSFAELLITPYNLKIRCLDRAKGNYYLTWNNDNYIYDNFDSYPPFTVHPSSESKKWTYWDLDKDQTVVFDGIIFPHTGEPSSFIVFNPKKTNPNIAFQDRASLAYSGDQYLASFGNQNQANRDFLFSPVFHFDQAATLSCKIRSFTNQLGKTKVRVGYTTVAEPKSEADIIWQSEVLDISDQSWQELIVPLPQNAVRAVLAHMSPKTFFVMIDDLFVGEESPFATGELERPQIPTCRYLVELDGNTVGANMIANALTLEGVAEGVHTVKVVASYFTKELAQSLVFDTSKVLGKELVMKQNIKVYPNPATSKLYVEGLEVGEELRLYSLDGILQKSLVVDRTGTFSVTVETLPRGTYILTKGDVRCRVLLQ